MTEKPPNKATRVKMSGAQRKKLARMIPCGVLSPEVGAIIKSDRVPCLYSRGHAGLHHWEVRLAQIADAQATRVNQLSEQDDAE